jgi:hypothetical protein
MPEINLFWGRIMKGAQLGTNPILAPDCPESTRNNRYDGFGFIDCSNYKFHDHPHLSI